MEDVYKRQSPTCMEELEHDPIFMHENDASSRASGLALGLCAWLPESKKADPILCRPPLESDVRCKHDGREHSSRVLEGDCLLYTSRCV